VGGHRGAAYGRLIVPMPSPVEEGPQGPGQLPGVGVHAGGRGVVDGGQQRGMLGGEPVQGLLVVGDVFRGDPRLGWDKRDRVPGRVQ
jgi:hypothetical protein